MSCPEEIIYKWYKKGNPRGHLDISNWEMDELPEIPDEVEWLNVSNTTIKHLKGLPKNLKYLYCKSHDIETIETPLPPNLEFIDIRGSKNLEPFDIPKHVKVRSNIDEFQRERYLLREKAMDNHHELVQKRIEKWIEENKNKKQKTKLDLTLLKVEEYQGIPEDVEWLICDGNTKIQSLKGLPKGLKRLEFNGYPLKDISGLPPNLEYLTLNSSRLEILDNIPDTVQKIKMTFYSCLKIIKSLPSSLRILNLNLCPDLEEIQCNFPSTLKMIDIHMSSVKTIPILPESLTTLDVSMNYKLEGLPNIPQDIKWLVLNSTNIKSIPPLPDGILSLHVESLLVLNDNSIPNSIRYFTANEIVLLEDKLQLHRFIPRR